MVDSEETVVDVTFNVFSDTPPGKDPDSHSPTLRTYHSLIWSKELPSGHHFQLDLDYPRMLHHKSSIGEFFLSSDQIGNTYQQNKSMQSILSKVPSETLEDFEQTRATIAGHALFPSNRIDNKMTINGARGVSHKVKDRFDLTLECIRRFYAGEQSPLSTVLHRYSAFFDLFDTFKGYVEFFLYQDLVSDDCETVRFWHHFDDFKGDPLPASVDDYLAYKERVVNFIHGRNSRIAESMKLRVNSRENHSGSG